MTTLQQVVLKLEMDYVGHPYYVSGNAILHAIAPELSYETQRALSVSHGVFAPGQMGTFPDRHSQRGARPGIGSSCIDIETYDDLFLHRDAAQPWLLDSRARDAINAHGIRQQGDHATIAAETVFGKPEEHRYETDTTTTYIHCYLLADDPDPLPLDASIFDGIHLGGKRNYGYGEVSCNDTQTVDFERIDFSLLEGADDYLLELVTPYVLTSEHPKTTAHDIPWWWDHETPLRRRREQIIEQREPYELETIDHGQVVGYGGHDPIETAKNGVWGIGTHSKYGFGEIRVKPLDGEGSTN